MHIRSTFAIGLLSVVSCVGCSRDEPATGLPAAQEVNPERAYRLDPTEAKQRAPRAQPEGAQIDPQVEPR